MLGDSRLNVYVLDTHLTPRHRERLQAQLGTAMRALPAWAFDLLSRRLEETGDRNFPLIVKAQPSEATGSRPISLGEIEGRPAVRLTPALTEDGIDWGQDLPLLMAKAVAYLAAPSPGDAFWQRWHDAVERDRVREHASSADDAWSTAGERDLFIEMFAAYALKPSHERWQAYPSVRAFFEGWHNLDP